MDIQRRIKYLRHEASLTQQELADKAGLGLASIQRYEKGERLPSIEALEAIAKALDVPFYELLADSSARKIWKEHGEYKEENPLDYAVREREIKSKAEKIQNLSKQIEKLNTDGKVKVCDYIDDLDPKYKKK